MKQLTIIGAGLSGSLLSLYLAKRGYDVTVYERRPDMRRTKISAGRSINLALANRGIVPLEEVGVFEAVKQELIPMRGRMLHDLEGNLQFQAYGQRPEEVIYSVSRGGLNSVLMDAAEATGRVRIQFNQRCQSVDLERQTLQLIDESTQQQQEVSFTQVIGTDGSGSAVRESIIEASGGQFTEEELGHSYKELNIPPAVGSGFQIEKEALHIWPRGEYMLIALPNLDGSFTVTLFLPNEGPQSFASLNNQDALQSFFSQQFPDSLPLLPELNQDFFHNPTGRLATVRCNTWFYEDKALILGDAAHAIVPFHGQGMNCAFEDCRALNQALEQHGENWTEVFSHFQKERLPNANAIADLALDNYIEMRNTVRSSLFHLKKALSWELEKRYPEQFIPRYSMVMFHHIPYAEAQRRGVIQNQILEQLLTGKQSLEEVDYEEANTLITESLSH